MPTLQVGLPASVPNTESVREDIVKGMPPVLETVKVKVTLPPVSGTLVGLAALAIAMAGLRPQLFPTLAMTTPTAFGLA